MHGWFNHIKSSTFPGQLYCVVGLLQVVCTSNTSMGEYYLPSHHNASVLAPQEGGVILCAVSSGEIKYNLLSNQDVIFKIYKQIQPVLISF